MIEFALGHGTGNDFVVLPDPDGVLDLTPARVRALCDRHRGLGADGVLRPVRLATMPGGALPDVPAMDPAMDPATDPDRSAPAEWFMDYRNADGSLAEMCGNGIRVLARFLVDSSLAEPGRCPIATRAGTVVVEVPERGDISVDMGAISTPPLRAMPQVVVDGRGWEAVGVLAPNPHAVAFVTDLQEAGDLREPPEVVPAAVFPDGVNVEFVVAHDPHHIAMRVHERGSGETLSCGTGAVAAAWAAARRADLAETGWTMRVDVPGGSLTVRSEDDGRVTLIGPAVIIARGHLDPEWERLAWT